MVQLLLVFFGGGLGCVSRYGIMKLVVLNFKTNFPFATLISNVLSCIILISVVIFFSHKQIVNQNLELFLLLGFCGGFSTFSTFSLETVMLLRSGDTSYAVLNIILNMALCIGIIFMLSKKITF